MEKVAQLIKVFQGEFHATRGHNCIIITITQWNAARPKLTRVWLSYWIKLFMRFTLSTRLTKKHIYI